MSLRSASIDRLDGGALDVLIVGGGINGAVAAAALSARGARVGLVEARDFAGGTSEQSSNLVWGGIKYLENYEFGLVRELCVGRNRLLRAYPSTVREIRFLATLDRGGPHAPWFIEAGALAYWAIGSGRTRPPALLTTKEIERREPVVDVGRARGGVEYSDGYLVDNDARFVFGFVRSALNAGALAANYVRLVDAERVGTHWETRLRDEDSGEEYELTARVLINAAGPFADRLNTEHRIRTRHRVVLSKGIHLVVPRIGTNRRVLAFLDDTGRMFFVIPMGHRSVIGTTDTRVDDPDAGIEDEDRQFLLEQASARLRLEHPLTRDDVIVERCGVRPLVVDADRHTVDDGSWTSLSRRHVIEVDADRQHLTIYGGKLTDCLNVGREVHDHVRSLALDLGRYRADWYGEPPRSIRREFFRQAALMRLDDLGRPHQGTLTERLWRRYDLRAFAMLEAVRHDRSMVRPVIEQADYLRCELELAARTEMVTRLDDFLRRRSKIAMVTPHDDLVDAHGLQEACRILFGADAQRRYDEYFGGHTPLADRRAQAYG